MNRTTIQFIAFFVLLISTCSSIAQETRYVGEETVGAHSGENYYYTKSLTLTPGPSGSQTISSTTGDLFFSLIATNPPPSPEQNYVRVEVPRVPVSSETALTHMDGNEKTVSYTYSDGLGRTILTSAAEAGPLYEDLIGTMPTTRSPAGRKHPTCLMPKLIPKQVPSLPMRRSKQAISTMAHLAFPPTPAIIPTPPMTLADEWSLQPVQDRSGKPIIKKQLMIIRSTTLPQMVPSLTGSFTMRCPAMTGTTLLKSCHWSLPQTKKEGRCEQLPMYVGW